MSADHLFEPTLVVIGVSARTAPVAVRERFTMDDGSRHQALVDLARADGIEELAVLPTCERTEFLVWASDASLAATAVQDFLTRQYRLRTLEWKHFYRFTDEQALLHVLRVVAGLESLMPGDPEVLFQFRSAWLHAQSAGVCSTRLDEVFQQALAVGERVRQETGLGRVSMSIAMAAVELARQIFGTLERRSIVLIGAGRCAEQVARRLVESGAHSVRVLDRTFQRAAELAVAFGFVPAPMAERPAHLAAADIVISTVPASELAITGPEIENACRQRNGRPLLLVDAGLPRNIDPAARELPGVFLHDLDNLQEIMQRAQGERTARTGEAERIIASAASDFCSKLEAPRIVPIVVALRQKLDEICRQELDLYRKECGPHSDEQALEALASRISQQLAGSLAREIREHPLEQERLTAAVQRLFRLQVEAAAAGARS